MHVTKSFSGRRRKPDPWALLRGLLLSIPTVLRLYGLWHWWWDNEAPAWIM
jgi:hypothetical protein